MKKCVKMGKSFSLQRKNWESDFFQIEIAELLFGENDGNHSEELIHLLNSKEFQLIECNLNSSNFSDVMLIQKNNFVLVDTRIQFMSKIAAENFSSSNHKGKVASIRNAIAEDQDAINNIVKECFVDFPAFVSRYKNRDYFPHFSASKYFKTWVKNSFLDSESRISVSTDGDQVTGFYIMKKIGQKEGLNVYKGVLCAVKKEYRGNSLLLQLQNDLLSKSNEKELYYDSTTQLSNYAVINNHIKAGRHMNKISFTFYRKVDSN